MNIALIQCPVWGTYDPPLALAQLSSCLKSAGHKANAFDLNIELYVNRTQNYKHMWAWEQSSFWYKEDEVEKFFTDNEIFIEKYINEVANSGKSMICFFGKCRVKIIQLKISEIDKNINNNITIVFGGPLFLGINLLKIY